MADIIKSHSDIMTVPEAKEKLMNEYREQGYEIDECMINVFKLMLNDGYVLIWWEQGAFYQEIYNYDDEIIGGNQK